MTFWSTGRRTRSARETMVADSVELTSITSSTEPVTLIVARLVAPAAPRSTVVVVPSATVTLRVGPTCWPLLLALMVYWPTGRNGKR